VFVIANFIPLMNVLFIDLDWRIPPVPPVAESPPATKVQLP
jgi:hypothetical protein